MTVHKYLIGIGGSGAKCVESLVHMAAAGLFKSNEPVHLAMIDPDKTNWNLKELKSTLVNYQSAKNALTNKPNKANADKDKTNEWFSSGFEAISSNSAPKSQSFDNLVWSPVYMEDTSLKLLLDVGNASNQERRLFETLYSKSEMNEKLQYGFKGHPAIGSLLIAKEFDPDLSVEQTALTQNNLQQNYWTRFCGRQSEITNIIADGSDVVRIMVVGSIFGGTGAAGVPTVIGKLHKLYEKAIAQGKVQLGLVLMLPYFKFNKTTDGMQNGELCAEADDFIMNSRYALKYYNDSGIAQYANQIYLVGNNYYENMDFSVGGVDQKNPALVPETVAAIGISEFFGRGIEENESSRNVLYACRKDISDANADAAMISFEEFPRANEFKTNILNFTRFAMGSSRFLHIAQNIYDNPGMRIKESWYTVYFHNMRAGLVHRKPKEAERLALKTEQDAINQYLLRYLEWAEDTLKDVDSVNEECIAKFLASSTDTDFAFSSLYPITKDFTWKSLKLFVRESSPSKNATPVQALCSNIREYTAR